MSPKRSPRVRQGSPQPQGQPTSRLWVSFILAENTEGLRNDKFGLFMREIRPHQKLQEDENMLIYHMKVYFQPVKLYNLDRSADLQASYLRVEVSLQPRVSSEPEL